MKYRSEVDGLRAIAIIPVIFFHAGYKLFGGGFVGVDIFFVISGYLITTIILRDMEDGRFSLLKFYERRARRILPALFFVVLICLPVAWISLTPEYMKHFSQSLAFLATFSSNFLFWRESGYFDKPTELKPMLHTWSLSVEEQYYVLFPLFLMVAWRFGKKVVVTVLVFIFLISLGGADWGAYNKPEAAFFLLPTRGWEILLGAFCSLILRERLLNFSLGIKQCLSLFGFILIGIAVFTFSSETPTPSLYTLVPTIGASLLILFANEGTLANRLLSMAPLVGIGLISYSAYLWHYPLFVFSRHYLIIEMTPGVMFALSMWSIILGWITWKYIEQPFRCRSNFNRNIIFVGSGLVSTLIFFIGLSGFFLNGFPQRVSDDLKYFGPNRGALTDGCLNCDEAEFPNTAIFGDSYSMHLYQFMQTIKPKASIKQFSYLRCPPFYGIAKFSNKKLLKNAKKCLAHNKNAVNQILESDSIRFVYISSNFDFLEPESSIKFINFNGAVTDPNYEFVLKSLDSVVRLFMDAGKQVVLVTSPAKTGLDIGKCLEKSIIRRLNLNDACDFASSKNLESVNLSQKIMYRIAHDKDGVEVLDLVKLLCGEGKCLTALNSVPLYNDNGHFTVEGSRQIGKLYLQLEDKR